MNFPPPKITTAKITTANLVKQPSIGHNTNNEEDETANCAFCFDSVQSAFTPKQSPHKNYNNTPFLSPMHRDNSDGSFKLFHNESTPSPQLTPLQPQQQPPTLELQESVDEIKWYDNDNTVCFVLCGHFFHVMCLMRCEQNSCPICRYYLFPESSSICNSCNLCTKDLWVCLTCGHVGCGRSQKQCAIKHYQSTNHIWAKCLHNLDVWDYADDDYVYRIVMAQIENDGTKLVSIQGQNDGIDGGQKHLPQELDQFSSVKQEEFIYEYNFLVQDKLKRLKIFHESKMKRMKKNGENEVNKLENEIKRVQREIENKNRNNDKLLSKYKEKYNDVCLPCNGNNSKGKKKKNKNKNMERKENDDNDNDVSSMEFVDDIEYLKKQLEEERNRGEKLKKMIHNGFVEQKTFNEKLKEEEKKLKQSLSMTESTLNVEINNLKNELRDYKAHIDTHNKMKKAASEQELNHAAISVKPGKSKNNQKREAKNKPHSNKKTKKSRKNRK